MVTIVNKTKNKKGQKQQQQQQQQEQQTIQLSVMAITEFTVKFCPRDHTSTVQGFFSKGKRKKIREQKLISAEERLVIGPN